MEMSQRICFWYQILLKMLIFEKMAKNHFFGQIFYDKLKEIILS